MKVHVITSCTDRKRVCVAPTRQLRQFSGVDAESLVSRWGKALLAEGDEGTPARDVYAGEHWVEFLRVVDSRPNGARVVGWVASAGYGIISLDSDIAGYAATFSPGSADSVARLGFTSADWWGSLSGWEGPCPESPRSVTEIVERGTSGDLVVVTASLKYLQAMENDLRIACEIAAAGTAADLLVMGSGVPILLNRAFPNHVVQFDSGLQRLVGGSRIGLNIRVVAKALEAGGVARESIRDWVAGAVAQYPPLPQPGRDRASDEEVSKFIAARLRDDPGMKASPLLREWRDRGMACEQGRFGRIFREVVQKSFDQRLLDLGDSAQ